MGFLQDADEAIAAQQRQKQLDEIKARQEQEAKEAEERHEQERQKNHEEQGFI